MDQNHEIFARYMNDKDFQRLVSEWMRRQVYDQARAQSRESVPANLGTL
jgi:type I restriction enzyme R subunit